MDSISVVLAYLLGLAARQIGLPPLVGFLVAGFALGAMGFEGGAFLDLVGEAGIQLLLFSIGLKLDVSSLLRGFVWGTASLHMAISTILFALLAKSAALLGLSAFAGMDWSTAFVLAFALSFSSTVFAVKAFEEKGSTGALHARVAIAILIMQDIFAVLFLVVSEGKWPTVWAGLLLALPLIRPVLMWMMSRSGHGELLVLVGVIYSLGAAAAFDAVGVKPDLGPLVFGVLLAGHPKAEEMSRSLLGLKDLLLTGFFLSIGLNGIPGPSQLVWAAALVALVPIKSGLFFLLLSRYRLRTRTAFVSTLGLSNYSEFGLIVASGAVALGLLGSDWLVTLAISVAATFVLAAPLNRMSDGLFLRLEPWLGRFESVGRVPEEEPIDVGCPEVVVVGMGRVGAGAYDRLRERYGASVLGVDQDRAVVEEHVEAGRDVIVGELADPDFVHRLQRPDSIRMVMLAIPSEIESEEIALMLRSDGYEGMIAATVVFPDVAPRLEDAGVGIVFNFYADAGAGFADHVCRVMDEEELA